MKGGFCFILLGVYENLCVYVFMDWAMNGMK